MKAVVAGLSRAGDAGDWTIAIIASALALASGLFAVAAVRRLGAQWSFVARVTESHELITSGPYAIVRHPIYAAMLGLLIATGLTFGTLGVDAGRRRLVHRRHVAPHAQRRAPAGVRVRGAL